MNLLRVALVALLAFIVTRPATAAPDSPRCYELRTYYAEEGKLEALQARFRDHTIGLFERHGMTNVAYWTPMENPERLLIYLLSYPDRAAREASWKAFGADPEWNRVRKESEADGPLVKKADSLFLELTDFSPEMKLRGEKHTFEMRTYTVTPGNLPALHARFRDHTIGLFSKHGMQHFGYFSLAAGQPGADVTLLYFLAHASPEAAKASFDAFRADPAWIAAKDASEKAAGGSLTVPDGVKSLMLVPTAASPVK